MTEAEDEHEFLGVEWEVEVRDADGNVTDSKKGKNSLLVAMAQILYNGFDFTGVGATCRNTSNALSGGNWDASISGNQAGFYCAAAISQSNYGIVVGRGNTAVTVDDYKLETQATHGTGANQFTHMAGTVNAVVNASPRSSVRIDRQFTNGSGNPITVKELGIYAMTAGPGYHCVCRDVIADTVVANGSSLFVKYTLYITI